MLLTGAICTLTIGIPPSFVKFSIFRKDTVEGFSADACESIIARNHLSKDNIDWVIPHQANQRIITAVTQRLEVPAEKVMVNIERYGNTSAGTLPLCLWDFEDKLKKGDNLILTAFGAGFAWGAIYIKWGYDGKNR